MALAPLAACSSVPVAPRFTDAQCMGFASALQTLQIGDPLPRVQEVLGTPSRQYQAIRGLGRRADVLEYDTGRTPCASFLLDAPHKLVLQFDGQGRLASYGRTGFLPFQGASIVQLRGLGSD
jgi:hypothetical protein